MTDRRPLCFVLMPFGIKPDENGRRIDFDAVYEKVIRPAVEGAGLECVRADEEKVGGIIHKPMFERLFLCDFAVADLTTANANVFYELGIRHALRPHTTVLVAAAASRLPFDLGPVRVQLYYALTKKGKPLPSAKDDASLQQVLTETRRRAGGTPYDDSPVYQLIGDILEAPPPRPKGAEMNAFKERLARANRVRDRIAAARRAKDVTALVEVESVLRAADALDLADVRTLLHAYRSIEAFEQMTSLAESLPDDLRNAVEVREQYGLALNRRERRAEAEAVLTGLIGEIGPNGETCGILGRVYKDEWLAATDPYDAARLLDLAIRTYLRGFEADWRSYYPGVNALELMTIRDPDDPEIARLHTVVKYSADRVVASGEPDYWVCATLVELAVLAGDLEDARRWLDAALERRPDTMSVRGTLESIERLRTAAERRGAVDEYTAGLRHLEGQLTRAL